MNEKTEKIKKIRNLLLAGGCIITAIICRHLPANRESGWLAFFQLTRAYLYITLYCVWGISLQRRIVNRTARRCLCGIASLMVFWFVIRTLKYNVFYEPVLRRYSWYGYYVPLLAIPSLSVIAALKAMDRYFPGDHSGRDPACYDQRSSSAGIPLSCRKAMDR